NFQLIFLQESDYFTEQGEFRVDAGGSKTLLNCLMYKMSYYRFGELKLDYRMPSGYDRTRNAEIGHKNFDLNHLEEAFTSEHWLVRIFRVKKLENRAKISHQERKVRYAKKTPKKKKMIENL
uniref:Dolichyl-diphosphooligosaccharide--protein glycotransferase n=1 Tax=Romanomermis culicivorax TaxID=13658 RepID=A0A915HSB7_ROMCU